MSAERNARAHWTSWDSMFERREEIEKWFNEVVERFRQKGAVSPDKAMTAEELSPPPRFALAMKRRLGRSGVFVEVNGQVLSLGGNVETNRRNALHENYRKGSKKEYLGAENSSTDCRYSFHGLLLDESPFSELGTGSRIIPLPRNLASHIYTTDLLSVKDQEGNVFKRMRRHNRNHFTFR